MSASELRLEARKKLQGKWGKAALITLAYVAFFFVINFIFGLLGEKLEGLTSLIKTIIDVPLSFGLIISYLKIYNDEDASAFGFIKDGFSNFAKSWKISLWIAVKMILPIVLMIVSIICIGVSIYLAAASVFTSSSSTACSIFTVIGSILFIASTIWSITKSYYYQLAYFIAIENPDLLAKEAVEQSQQTMKGNRAKLFFLELSFIGWAILGILTLGIGYLWLIPYMQITTIVFYKFVSGNISNIEVQSKVENDDNPISE